MTQIQTFPHTQNTLPACTSPAQVGRALSSDDLQVGIDALVCRFRIDALVGNSLEDWRNIKVPSFDAPTIQASAYIPFHEECTIRLGVKVTQRVEKESPVESSWDTTVAHEALVKKPVIHARVEVNPSRVIDPEGTRAVPLDEALSAVEMICPSPFLEDWILWRDEPAYWDLYRLDLAVDVETPGITQQVLAIAEAGLRGPRRKVIPYKGSTGDLETVRVHMKTRPNLSVYDKALQSRTGPARVRFEVQLNRTYLRANFPRLGDLTNAALRQCFLAHFSKVIEFLQADDKALYDLQLSEADKKTMREIVGYETLCEKGYTETLTRSVRRRFEDFHKRHSIRQVSDLL